MYLVGGFWLDPTVRWPPPYTFAAPLGSLAVTSLLTGALLILVASFRVREHRAREALAASLAELERTQAELIAAEKASLSASGLRGLPLTSQWERVVSALGIVFP